MYPTSPVLIRHLPRYPTLSYVNPHQRFCPRYSTFFRPVQPAPTLFILGLFRKYGSSTPPGARLFEVNLFHEVHVELLHKDKMCQKVNTPIQSQNMRTYGVTAVKPFQVRTNKSIILLLQGGFRQLYMTLVSHFRNWVTYRALF